MDFVTHRRVRFAECDPAGIVFFPQYLLMVNGQVEDWLQEHLGHGFGGLVTHRRIGLPTVHLDVDFKGVSRLEDDLRIRTQVQRVGDRSLTLLHRIEGAGGDLRAQVQQVLVSTSLESHAAIALPAELRAAAERALVPAAG